jgi:hypothetical protein
VSKASGGRQPPEAIRVLITIAVFAWGSFACADEPDFADELRELAATCDKHGLPTQAEISRNWLIVPRSPGRQYLFLPGRDDLSQPKPTATEVERQWYKRFREMRGIYAQRLFTAARQASDAGNGPLAYRLLFEVLREHPEHAAALAILNRDATDPKRWAVQQPKVPHAQMGWPAGKHWRLQTPHFVIATDHSPREAQELGRQLEDLHSLWQQLFFRYWSSDEALAARFAGRDEPLARPRPRMNVILVKDRAEYVRHLKPGVPQVEQTVGIYLNKRRTSFFYAGDTSVYPTWYHEATHQLFQEAGRETIEEPGERQNFWAVEAAALYMESLANHGGYWTAGGCEADRLQFARYRTLAGDAVPLSRLVAMSREEVQTSADISKLYSHAAGLAHFLIDGQGGKHREDFVKLLAAVYRGEDTSESLAKVTGTSLEQLDHQYRNFFNVTDDDLSAIPRPQRLKNLSLGRTAVTDKGLAALAPCKQLEWLDLSHLPVTDAGFAQLAGSTKLKQLFLEGTKLTDASLPQLAACKQLEELDLSNLAISDERLVAIAGLKQLRVLHLTGSPITDAGLVHLRGLKQLETLETAGTKVTTEGRKKLEAVLTRLQGE